MVSGYVPPPPQTVPAEIRTIDADHYQRLDSPLQNEINNFNPDGTAPVLRYEQPEQAQPDNGKREQDLNDNVEDIAGGVAKAREMQDESEKRKDAHTAEMLGKDGVNSSGGGEPPSDPEEATTKQERPPSESSGESTDKGQSNDCGDYDYYNGIM